MPTPLPPEDIPRSILIVGSGVFGLTTAYSLARNEAFANTTITVLDRQSFPAPDASSIDSSRIIRADYADPAYASLAFEAQQQWRDEYAAAGLYHEDGLCLVADPENEDYVRASLENVRSLQAEQKAEGKGVQTLSNAKGIKDVLKTDGVSGSTGYVNWQSGWADAEGCMRHLYTKVAATKRVHFLTGTVSRLIIDRRQSPPRICGVWCNNPSASRSEIRADLTILAAGAWTPSLIDLRGIAQATGQVLTYIALSPSEKTLLSHRPIPLNMSTGMFIMIPTTPLHNHLKIARHGYGYSNPVTLSHPEDSSLGGIKDLSLGEITVSQPWTSRDDPHLEVPQEGQQACRDFLSQLYPDLANRPFEHTRICWYSDTRDGDFLVDFHPDYSGLFVATGGSGHAFKFLPVLGERVVQCVMGQRPEAFREKWAWPKERVPFEKWSGDGSRGGRRGMVLEEELRGEKSRL